MRLPRCLLKRFLVMPINIGNHNLEDCKFLWERKISVREKDQMMKQDFNKDKIVLDGHIFWYELGEQIAYCLTDDDVAHHIRFTCYPKDKPKVTSVSRTPVEIGPLECPFEKRHHHTKSLSSHFRFMSYNILADLYADSEFSRTVLFKHCPTYALALDYRRQLLLNEISGYNSTIICLQEVDQKEFLRTFEPYLRIIRKYDGVYAKKAGKVAEGVATFFQQSEFELIDHHRTLLPRLIEQPELDPDHPILNDSIPGELQECFEKLSDIRSTVISSEKLKKRFIDRNTVLQTNLLRSKTAPHNYLLVANTHLYFAPDADHIRLLQGALCLKYIEYLKDYYTRSQLATIKNPEAKISVIFCGDMNSLPENGFHMLMTEGKVDSNHPDWSKNKEEAVEGLKITTKLRFSSAYKDVPYTNYVPSFNGCLDYIYYEKDSLKCDSVVPLPDHEDVTASDGLPSDVFPSDHLALVANMSYSH